MNDVQVTQKFMHARVWGKGPTGAERVHEHQIWRQQTEFTTLEIRVNKNSGIMTEGLIKTISVKSTRPTMMVVKGNR